MECNFQEWLTNFFNLQGKNTPLKLKKILIKLGFTKKFKIINIVGTNGKGSVTNYVNNALIVQGFKVGKFVSPHLVHFNERIAINNEEISNQDFYDLVNQNLTFYKKEKLSWFEILYLSAMFYFQKHQIDFAVIEAGIGGSYDATNAIAGEYGLLTSIAIDHLNLFKTWENIVLEKSGIINQDMIFILPSVLKTSDQAVFKQQAKKVKAKIIKVNNKGSNYKIRNQKLANALIKLITKQNIKNYVEPACRTQIEEKNKFLVVYDVAHNYDGIKKSLIFLKEQKIKIEQIIISLSKDKDDQKMEKLFKIPIFIYQHQNKNAKLIENFKIKGKIIEDLKNFYDHLNKNTLFIGSFFFIKEILILKKKDGK